MRTICDDAVALRAPSFDAPTQHGRKATTVEDFGAHALPDSHYWPTESTTEESQL
jgi:hypothetical protein